MSTEYDSTVTGSDLLLGISDYAAQAPGNPTTRTVNRWLAAGELPGARKDPSGTWLIPATATRQPRVAALEAATPASTPAPSAVVTVQAMLDVAPILLTLTEAGAMLGLSASEVAAMRRHGDIAGVKIAGKRWRIPVGEIRRLAGV